MRKEGGGYEIIKKAVEKLRHKEHIAIYGEGNDWRLNKKYETVKYIRAKYVHISNKK